jgi:glycerol-3-phosphate O-acyltransferase
MKQVVVHPRVIEDMAEWPIYLLSQDRENFIREIDEFTFERLVNQHKRNLPDVIGRAIYQERIRIKEDPWKVDPPNERSFWNKVSKKLIKRSLDRKDEEARTATHDILQQIIHRYSEEIVGTFKIPTFRFAQRFLTVLFNRIFNAAVAKSIRGLWRGRRQLYEQLNIVGDVEIARALFKQGTIVVVPTHSSNLDSILVGYAMDQIMGLPSFSYGAGLNLYNFGPAAYFMNRLGAYRVDRRKKNSIYLETLKAMSNLSIQRGVNSLFFPGGTRSRSGALEDDLKMGLLGTALEAQQMMCEKALKDGVPPKKVFIVPMVISYHFVLEAPFLIENYLQSTGKESYLRLKDEGQSIRGWLRYIWRFLSTTSDITLSVGKPMDVMGNFVDFEGRSIDRFGRELHIQDYFSSGDKLNSDRQREGEYTKLLAERIVERYRVENVVLTSHLVAYAVFSMLLHEHPKLDLYGILRLPTDDFMFPVKGVEEVVAKMQAILFDWEQKGKIKLSPDLHRPAVDVVHNGVNKLGLFHKEQPLRFTKSGDVMSSNFRVLYFYYNRLESYHLDKTIVWKSEEIEVLKLD